MANIKSAKKRIRQIKKRTKRNRSMKLRLKKAMKTLIKKGEKGVSLKDYSEVQSIIDKAAKRRVIHSNKASRLKSRLIKKVKIKKQAKTKKSPQSK